jgi:hypothetical protein
MCQSLAWRFNEDVVVSGEATSRQGCVSLVTFPRCVLAHSLVETYHTPIYP